MRPHQALPQFVGTQPTGAHEVTTPFNLAAGQGMEISPSKAARHYMVLQNRGIDPLYFAVGRKATIADFEVSGGDYYEPINPPRGSINVYAPTATAGVLLDG